MDLQTLILNLSRFWGDHGCVIQQPLDLEVGAGTMHPETFLRVLGPRHWNVAYVQPSRRPADGTTGWARGGNRARAGPVPSSCCTSAPHLRLSCTLPHCRLKRAADFYRFSSWWPPQPSSGDRLPPARRAGLDRSAQPPRCRASRCSVRAQAGAPITTGRWCTATWTLSPSRRLPAGRSAHRSLPVAASGLQRLVNPGAGPWQAKPAACVCGLAQVIRP